MTEISGRISRRDLLGKSAALAAVGILGACTPTGSGPGISASPTAGAAVRGGRMITAQAADPATFNPGISTLFTTWRASAGLFNSLIQLNSKYEAVPDAAERWTIAPDGLRYEFKLRPGIKFHDGTDLTSADVKYSMLEVSAKYNSQALGPYANIDRVDTPDAQTVVINLKAPTPALLIALGGAQLTILPRALFEGSDPRNNPRNQNPIGSGPFKFKEWVKGSSITLVRNENYFKSGLPYLDQITVQIVPDAQTRNAAFTKGEIDYMDSAVVARDSVAQLRQQIPGVQINERSQLPSVLLLSFNTKRPNLSDVRVRQALATAIDRKTVVDKGYFAVGATPSKSFIPPSLANFHNPATSLPAFDIALANRMLDDAGVRRGADGVRFRINLKYDQGVRQYQGATATIRDNLKEVGVELQLVPIENAQVGPLYESKDFDLIVVELGTGGDPVIGIQRSYTTKQIGIRFGNGSEYSNAIVDKGFEDGATTADLEKRKAAYFAVQAQLLKDMPTVPLADVFGVDIGRPEMRGLFEQPYSYYTADSVWRQP